MQNKIDEIKKRFEAGERIIEIMCDDPLSFRRNLYKATRRRGLLWRFAVTEKSIFVIG